MRGDEPMTVPVVTDEPNGMASLPGMEAFEWFTSHTIKAPKWENKVTLRRYIDM